MNMSGQYFQLKFVPRSVKYRSVQ